MTIYWGDGTNTTTNPTGGKIVQVTSSDFTTSASNSSTQTWEDTGLTCSITPTSSSNDIIVNYCLCYSAAGSAHTAVRLMRGSTPINIATFGDSNQTRATQGGYSSGGHWIFGVSGSFTDSPSTTSAIAYHFEMRTNNGTMYINRNTYSQNQGYAVRAGSHMTLMEVS